MAEIWITGAHGFIGRHLAASLSSSGHTVSGIGHGAWSESERGQWGVRHWLSGDVLSVNLRRLSGEAGRPDCVFHLAGGSSVGAAIASPLQDLSRTVESTAELLEWARVESPTSRIIVASSAAVYGSKHRGAISEGTPCEPFSPYGFHKLMMEQVCRSYSSSYGVQTAVARLFSVYGSGLQKQLLWDLCGKLGRDSGPVELGGSGDELRDWTDIRDVVRALALVMELASPNVPVINLGTGIATSVRGIAGHVLSNWPSEAAITFSGTSRPGDPFSLIADTARLDEFGFQWRVPVADGVRDYVNWYLASRRGNG